MNKNIFKDLFKNIIIAVIMQTVIMFSHFIVHIIPYGWGGVYSQIICSFIVVIVD